MKSQKLLAGNPYALPQTGDELRGRKTAREASGRVGDESISENAVAVVQFKL